MGCLEESKVEILAGQSKLHFITLGIYKNETFYKSVISMTLERGYRKIRESKTQSETFCSSKNKYKSRPTSK